MESFFHSFFVFGDIMRFISTRGKSEVECAANAIAKGLADDGGLFVPEKFPSVTMEEIQRMTECSYAERAATVLHKYLEEYATEEWVENNFATNGDVDDEIGKLENSLQFQIDSKQPKGDYISENELKTINGQSILGDGDITVAGGKIIEITQAEYDDITPEPDAIYVVTDAESVDITQYATLEYVNDLIGDIDKILDEIIG